MLFDKSNKVYIKGTIMNTPTLKLDKYANENILEFVVAVPRTEQVYIKGYNADKYNYFYCLIAEHNHTLQELKTLEKTLDKMQLVEIKGCLDNRVREKDVSNTRTQKINYRALNLFVSTIIVSSIDKAEDNRSQDEVVAEKQLLQRIRQSFGSDVDITIKKDAYDYDYFGFNKNDDLPDY